MAKAAQRPMDPRTFESIFGRFSPNHSFSAHLLNWGLKLTEPQATRALAHLISAGEGELRSRRIKAFLHALGAREVPDLKTLQKCQIEAERDRIDPLFRLPIVGTDKFRPVVVEAKFDHKITKGQLSRYRKAVAANKSNYLQSAEYFILGLNQSASRGMISRQSISWKFVSWTQLWLKFEKLRPQENNQDLELFMRTLWDRIKGLIEGGARG